MWNKWNSQALLLGVQIDTHHFGKLFDIIYES